MPSSSLLFLSSSTSFSFNFSVVKALAKRDANNFDLLKKPQRAHALLSVVCTSRSQRLYANPISLAACTAVFISSPGFTPNSLPRRRWKLAKTRFAINKKPLPSLKTFVRFSFSQLSFCVIELYRAWSSSTQTISGLFSQIIFRTSSMLSRETCAVPISLNSFPFSKTVVMFSLIFRSLLQYRVPQSSSHSTAILQCLLC